MIFVSAQWIHVRLLFTRRKKKKEKKKKEKVENAILDSTKNAESKRTHSHI